MLGLLRTNHLLLQKAQKAALSLKEIVIIMDQAREGSILCLIKYQLLLLNHIEMQIILI